jgi:uncharacterized membrane protein
VTPTPGPSFAARLAPIALALLPGLLVLAGLVCLVVAAFTYNTAAGWAASGVGFLALQHFLSDPTPPAR